MEIFVIKNKREMIKMNEQTFLWFLQKINHHLLSREAIGLWMDFYTYLQNQNRARNPQVSFVQLQQICDLKDEDLQVACQELKEAGMLQFTFENNTVWCRLTAERFYCTPSITAG